MNKIVKEKSENAGQTDLQPPSSGTNYDKMQETIDTTASIKMSNQKIKKENNQKQPKKSPCKKHQKKFHLPWVVIVFFLTVILSFIFGILSQLVVGKITIQSVYIAYILILFIVVLSIITDMIGVAATSCDLEPLYAMSARKVRGAKLAVKLAKSANIVSSVCCDVIGDICGIISGACGAAIVACMAINDEKMLLIISVLASTIIAGIMITGKAFGKKIAIKNSTKIIFLLGQIMSVFSKK